MLTKITLECEIPPNVKPSVHWGSLMHGALMGLVSTEAANKLHSGQFRPFSQYIEIVSIHKLLWHIGIWGKDATETLLSAIMPLSTVTLNYHNLTLPVLKTHRESVSEEEYMARFFTEAEPANRYEMRFLTPCTHRSAGQYVLYPTPELIYQSLALRFSAYSQEFDLHDPEVIEHLGTHTRITRYSLKSSIYQIEDSVRIHGYIGYVCLSLRGPEALIRLGGMLLSLAEYAGVGVKTTMGMGGVQIKAKGK